MHDAEHGFIKVGVVVDDNGVFTAHFADDAFDFVDAWSARDFCRAAIDGQADVE